MEDVYTENNSKKRARVDPDLDAPESDRVKSESPELNSPEAKRIREDLLDMLDDSDPVPESDPEIIDLDSVIKSFEEEILHLPSPVTVVDQSSESGESQPELGYLLEASDDELGLPPTISPTNDPTSSDPRIESTNTPNFPFGFDGFVGFEDDMPSYDSFGFGIGGDTHQNGDLNSEFVTLGGGLFDFQEDSDDYSEFLWRPESLPAL